ncbi:MAG: carbohydrate ABC transporter permease [Saccharofermentanales bacterium]
MNKIAQIKNPDKGARRYFKRITGHRISKFIYSNIRFILLLGLAFIIMYPLLVKLSVSIMSEADKVDPTVIFIPRNPTLSNYKLIWEAINYPLRILYSTLFISMQSILQALTCAFVAYGLARYKFKLNNVIFLCILITLVIPPQVMLTPLYLRFKYFGIFNLFKFTGTLSGIDFTNTIIPFILLSLTAIAYKNGLYIFLLRQYYKNLPGSLEEAAYIDGCGHLRTFFKIMLPGSVPMLVSVFLFSFVWQWNDQYYSILAPKLPTLINKIFDMSALSASQMANMILQSLLAYSKLMMIIIPLIILYVFAQKFFVESIERSGITG